MNAVGILCSKGYGNLDREEAVTWFKRAGDLGYPQAWFNLGELYKFGYGVPQDFGKGFYIINNSWDQCEMQGGVCSCCGQQYTGCDQYYCVTTGKTISECTLETCPCCGGTCSGGYCSLYNCSKDNCPTNGGAACSCCGSEYCSNPNNCAACPPPCTCCGNRYCSNKNNCGLGNCSTPCSCCGSTTCTKKNNCGQGSCAPQPQACCKGEVGCTKDHCAEAPKCSICGKVLYNSDIADCSCDLCMGHYELNEIPLPKTEKFSIPLVVKDSCERKSQINAIDTKNIFMNVKWEKQLGDTLLQAGKLIPKGIEKGLNLVQKKNGTYFATPVTTDSSESSVNLPPIEQPKNIRRPPLPDTVLFDNKTVASGHDHPNSTPPSWKDIDGLIFWNSVSWPLISTDPYTGVKKVIRYLTNAGYKDDYVIGKDTSVWALHVEDNTKVKNFQRKPFNALDSIYSRKDTAAIWGIKKKSRIGNDFKNAYDFFKDSLNFNINQAYAWSLAFALNSQKSGVKLLIRDQENNFNEINAYIIKEDKKLPDGSVKTITKFIATICRKTQK